MDPEAVWIICSQNRSTSECVPHEKNQTNKYAWTEMCRSCQAVRAQNENMQTIFSFSLHQHVTVTVSQYRHKMKQQHLKPNIFWNKNVTKMRSCLCTTTYILKVQFESNLFVKTNRSLKISESDLLFVTWTIKATKVLPLQCFICSPQQSNDLNPSTSFFHVLKN